MSLNSAVHELREIAYSYERRARAFPSGSHGRHANLGEAAKFHALAEKAKTQPEDRPPFRTQGGAEDSAREVVGNREDLIAEKINSRITAREIIEDLGLHVLWHDQKRGTVWITGVFRFDQEPSASWADPVSPAKTGGNASEKKES